MRARHSGMSRRWCLALALGTALLVGCESAVEPELTIAFLRAVTPTSLVGQVGRDVDQPPAVVALGADARPLSGRLVRFTVEDPAGSTRDTLVRTNSRGVADMGRWRLGRTAGAETVAAVSGSLQVLFHAVAAPGPAADIWVISGDGQIAPPGSVLSSLRVWVHDGDGYWNSVAGVPVTVTVVSGGGSIEGASTTTDSSGVAVVGAWTLGPSTDVQQVRVRAGPADALITAFASCEIGVTACGSVASLCASPEGCGRIAFVSDRDGNPEIYSIRPDGTDLVRLTRDGGADVSPAWSPDGTRIAFTSDRSGWKEIYVMDADGSNVVQRTFSKGSSTSPSWSPDGESITYAQSVSSAGAGLWNVASDSAGPAPALLFEHRGWEADPAWSPDGSRLALVCDWGAYDFVQDIVLTNPDGSDPVWLTSNLFDHIDYSDPAWSPDGGRLAVTIVETVESFEVSGTERWVRHVGVMALDGRGPTPLFPSSGGRASWSPDGELIAFTSPRGDVAWIRADGSGAGLIVENGHSPSWSR